MGAVCVKSGVKRRAGPKVRPGARSPVHVQRVSGDGWSAEGISGRRRNRRTVSDDETDLYLHSSTRDLKSRKSYTLFQ